MTLLTQEVTEKTYQWVIGMLLAAVVGLGGAAVGAYVERQEVEQINTSVEMLADELDEHEGLPAHAVSESRWNTVLRFMESIDNRLERLEDRP